MDVYARRPQVQERLTTQVADALVRILEPRGVIVVVECEHLCMSMRGVRKPGSRTITSAVRGQLRDPATRAEAMSLPPRTGAGESAPTSEPNAPETRRGGQLRRVPPMARSAGRRTWSALSTSRPG